MKIDYPTTEVGIKVDNYIIAYKQDLDELGREIILRLAECKKEEELLRFKNELLCSNFLRWDLMWDMDISNSYTAIPYFEIDFDKKKVSYKNYYSNQVIHFKFSDEVLFVEDEELYILVVDKVEKIEGNFKVIKDKLDKKYYVIKDNLYVLKVGSKDVALRLVLEGLK